MGKCRIDYEILCYAVPPYGCGIQPYKGELGNPIEHLLDNLIGYLSHIGVPVRVDVL